MWLPQEQRAKYIFRFMIVLFFIIAYVCTTYVQVYILKDLVKFQDLARWNNNEYLIPWNVIGYSLMFLALAFIFSYVGNYLAIRLAYDYQEQAIKTMTRKVIYGDKKLLNQFENNSLKNKMTHDLEYVTISIVLWQIYIFRGILLIIGGVITGFILSQTLSLFLSILLPFVLVIILTASLNSKKTYLKKNQQLNEFSNKVNHLEKILLRLDFTKLIIY